MIVRYSSLEKFEIPKFTLCSPGSVYRNGLLTNVVGMLTDHEAEEIVFNFNATSELNMRVNRVIREDPDENAHTYAIYKALQNKRLIFAEDIGYFMISSVNDGYENGVHYKDITAKSIDIEIERKMIPYIADGTYRFSTDISGNKGILETVVETIPLWTIGYIDDSVASKWRTFEDVDTSTNCLSFLLEKVQEAYECIFIFDIINRTISVYAQDNYVRQTDIHLTKDDLINSITVTENSDDLYTAINVLGDENVTISAINPLGTNVIYNFDYYISWMSEGLANKVVTWQKSIDNQMDNYYGLNLRYYTKLSEANNLQLELERLNVQIKMYSRCRENIIAESNTLLVDDYNTIIIENGGTPINVCSEIADTITSIDNLISECEIEKENVVLELDAINVDITNLSIDIKAIQDSLNIKTYFTNEEYTELSNYIFEGSYRDEYVTITDIMTYDEKFTQMKILFDRSKSQLERVSRPTQEFDISAENFIFSKKFQNWSEQLETGCLINVELDTNDIALLFLSNITINYDDRTLTMTFGNRFNKFDPKSLFNNVLGNITKSANTLNYIKEILYPIKNGDFDEVKEALQTSRTLTMNKALSSVNEEVIIDGSGYTGRRKLDNGEFDPQQIKLTSKNLVFTDDAWDSCKLALGEINFGGIGSLYGINAEAIVGNIILSSKLNILNENSSIILNETGISICNGALTIYKGADTNSRKALYCDTSGNLAIDGYLARYGSPVTMSIGYDQDYYHGIYCYTEHEYYKRSDGTYAPFMELWSSSGDPKTSMLVGVTKLGFAVKDTDPNSHSVYSRMHITASGGELLGQWQFGQDQNFKTNIGSNCFKLFNGDTLIGSFYHSTSNYPCLFSNNGNPILIGVNGNTAITARSDGGTLHGAWQFGQDQNFTHAIYGWNVGVYRNGVLKSQLYNSDSGSNCLASMDGSNLNLVVKNGNNWYTRLTATTSGGTLWGTWDFGQSQTFSNSITLPYIKVKSNGYQGSLWCDSNGRTHVSSESSNDVILSSNYRDGYSWGLRVALSNYDTGAMSGYLYGTWYGTSSQAIPSDLNKKHAIEEMDARYSKFFYKLNPVRFKYNDGTSERYHTGIIAQDVEKALTDCGIDSSEFAGFIKTEEDGYYLRYEEFIALAIYEIQNLKAKLDELTTK